MHESREEFESQASGDPVGTDQRPITTDAPKKKRGHHPPLKIDPRVTTGLTSLAKTGRVPRTLQGGLYIQRCIRRLRKEIDKAFFAIHGRAPTVYETMVLKDVCRVEAGIMLHERVMATRWDKLTHEQFSNSVAAIRTGALAKAKLCQEAGLPKAANEGNMRQRLKSLRNRAIAKRDGEKTATLIMNNGHEIDVSPSHSVEPGEVVDLRQPEGALAPKSVNQDIANAR